MFKPIQDFYEKYSSKTVLALMLIWVILLVFGTIAEIFDIEWVLDWTIWRPPGKYK